MKALILLLTMFLLLSCSETTEPEEPDHYALTVIYIADANMVSIWSLSIWGGNQGIGDFALIYSRECDYIDYYPKDRHIEFQIKGYTRPNEYYIKDTDLMQTRTE